MKWSILLLLLLFFTLCLGVWWFIVSRPTPTSVFYDFHQDHFLLPMPNGYPSVCKQHSFVRGPGANMVEVQTDNYEVCISELEFFLPTDIKREKHTLQIGFVNLKPPRALAGILNYFPKRKMYDLTCVCIDKDSGKLTQSEIKTNAGHLPTNTPMILQLLFKHGNKTLDLSLLTSQRKSVLSVGVDLPQWPNFDYGAFLLESDFCATKYSVNGVSLDAVSEIKVTTRLSVTYEEIDYPIFGMVL